MNAIQTAARALRSRGYLLCRILPGAKLPHAAGWSTRSEEPESFTEGDGIGIVCGPIDPGHSIVCVDLDSQAAIARADEFLPNTGMVDGRHSKPRSHRWYIVRHDSIPHAMYSRAEQAAPAAVARCNHPGPRTLHGFKGPDGKTAIDLQGTGAQAVVPPSVHASSGEVREWEGGAPGEPAVVDYMALLDAVNKLAREIGSTVPDNNPTSTTPAAAAWVYADDQDEAARRYEAALSKAVEQDGPPRTGHHGDPETLRMLAYGFGFGLRPEGVLSVFLRVVNDPLHALGDEWPEAKLRRKLDYVEKRGPDARYAATTTTPKPVPRCWDDPKRLADTLRDKDVIRFRGEDAFRYNGKSYVTLPGVEVRDMMRRHAESVADEQYRNDAKRHAEQSDAADRLVRQLEDQLDMMPADAAQAKVVGGVREALAEARRQRKAVKPAMKVAPPVSRDVVSGAVESLRAARALPSSIPFGTHLGCVGCPPAELAGCR